MTISALERLPYEVHERIFELARPTKRFDDLKAAERWPEDMHWAWARKRPLQCPLSHLVICKTLFEPAFAAVYRHLTIRSLDELRELTLLEALERTPQLVNGIESVSLAGAAQVDGRSDDRARRWATLFSQAPLLHTLYALEPDHIMLDLLLARCHGFYPFPCLRVLIANRVDVKCGILVHEILDRSIHLDHLALISPPYRRDEDSMLRWTELTKKPTALRHLHVTLGTVWLCAFVANLLGTVRPSLSSFHLLGRHDALLGRHVIYTYLTPVDILCTRYIDLGVLLRAYPKLLPRRLLITGSVFSLPCARMFAARLRARTTELLLAVSFVGPWSELFDYLEDCDRCRLTSLRIDYDTRYLSMDRRSLLDLQRVCEAKGIAYDSNCWAIEGEEVYAGDGGRLMRMLTA